QTGGEAKVMIQGGIVSVNGELETRRGTKLYPGDEVEVKGKGEFKITQE
ncbi:MAG: RNA-binding protein, partial [Candidatus Aenigmarchaeota archaeon]|nr:RNA-binding protein [Candidatus Aenigmarchaeota archaeon]